eukprot:5282375-Amphidinium_carterae.3
MSRICVVSAQQCLESIQSAFSVCGRDIAGLGSEMCHHHLGLTRCQDLPSAYPWPLVVGDLKKNRGLQLGRPGVMKSGWASLVRAEKTVGVLGFNCRCCWKGRA